MSDSPEAPHSISVELTPESEQPKESVGSGIKSLLPFAVPAIGRLATSAVIGSVAALAGIVPYWSVYQAALELLEPGAAYFSLPQLATVALFAVITRFVLQGISTYISHGAAFEIQYGIRIAIAEHLARIPLGLVRGHRSGQLKKVLADDVERLELFLAHAIPDLFAALTTFVVLLVWMLGIDWRMAAAVFGLALPAGAAISFAMRRGGQHMAEYKTTQGAMNAAIVELVRGMPVVKLFNRADREVRGTEEMIQRYVKVVTDYSLDFLPFGTLFYVLLASNVVLVLPMGVWFWLQGTLSSADLLFFLIVGLGALSTLVSLLFLFANLSHIASGGKLIEEVLAYGALTAPEESAEPIDSSIELQNVSFQYAADQPLALKDVSFRAEPNQLTALVGPSGSGKSTIAALVGRFWDATSGEVRIGNVPLTQIEPDVLSKHVTFVLQETFLFDDTVAANLRVARADATDTELKTAAKKARIHDVISALPDGYNTKLGELGVRLSGGERQRLAIARAILAAAPTLVLDEATAFVDPENEHAIQAALSELVVGKTVLMIAHRLSTIAGADQILVVDDGQIVERGQHQSLIAEGGLYAELWRDFNTASRIGLAAPKQELTL